MFPNNGASSSKRKKNSKEKDNAETLMDDLKKPFTSFTSLLMEDDADADDDEEDRFLHTHQKNLKIDHIIKAHSESLQRTLAEARRVDYTAIQQAAEARAAKRISEIEKEIAGVVRLNEQSEEREAHFKRQAEYWKSEAITMEETRKKLREAVRIARMRRGWEEEDEESSYVDPDRRSDESWDTWQACKACGERVGTVMMLPCRHVSACVMCESKVKACPFCFSPKTAAVEVRLP